MSTTATETSTEPTLEEALAALAAATHALQSANKRIEDLEARQPADGMPTPSFLPVHWVHLADGTVVEQEGAVPTHVDKGDENAPRLVPVTAAYRKE